jgi:hypothetical protein
MVLVVLAKRVMMMELMVVVVERVTFSYFPVIFPW